MPEKKFITSAEDIELNNYHEVDYILGNPPSWLLRYGMSIILMTTSIFLILAWFIQYPDSIPAKLIIITENPSIRVVPLANGNLKEIFVKDGEDVEKGKLLAILDNPANWEDIQFLNLKIELFKKSKSHDFNSLIGNDSLSLGVLQANFSTLKQKIENYLYIDAQQTYSQKNVILNTQIQEISKLNNSLKKQQLNLGEELEISNKQFLRNKQLFEGGVISEIEFEAAKTSYIRTKREFENFETQMINNNIKIKQIETEKIDLLKFRSDELTNLQLEIEENIQQLSAAINIWNKENVILAPKSGKISFSRMLNEKQFVKLGEEIMTIVPNQLTSNIIGHAILPIVNSGKVKTGQTVNIQLDGFPYQEYGIIKAKVKTISPIPQQENYLLIIDLPESLFTTYDKIIPFRQEMQGVANIITEDRRVLDRIFDRILSLLKNN